MQNGQGVEIASRDQVHTGKATILSNIAGDQVEEYEIEILTLYPESSGDTRNLMIQVTDPRLLETTGGIVQGMSGSPILQDGRLVGAVTHVLINELPGLRNFGRKYGKNRPKQRKSRLTDLKKHSRPGWETPRSGAVFLFSLCRFFLQTSNFVERCRTFVYHFLVKISCAYCLIMVHFI